MVPLVVAVGLWAHIAISSVPTYPASNTTNQHESSTSGKPFSIDEDPLIGFSKADEFWESQRHDLNEIERAYEREQKVRKAAEEEHKLNLRLRQALADGRENLSQLQRQVDDIHAKEIADRGQLTSVLKESEEKDDKINSLRSSLEEETRKEADLADESKKLRSQLADVTRVRDDFARQLNESQKETAELQDHLADAKGKFDKVEEFRRQLLEEQQKDKLEVTMAKEKARQVSHEIEQEANLKLAEADHQVKVANEEAEKARTDLDVTKRREEAMKRRIEQIRDTAKANLKQFEEDSKKTVDQIRQKFEIRLEEEKKRLAQDQYERKVTLYGKMMEQYNSIRNQYVQAQKQVWRYTYSILDSVVKAEHAHTRGRCHAPHR